MQHALYVEKSAWQTWNVCPEASTVFFFRKLSQYPPVIGEDDQSILEKFVVTMHDRFSATDSIDVARLELFAFHVCHALFFPLPRNADTTSQPVKA
jgi:hypothetical protein